MGNTITTIWERSGPKIVGEVDIGIGKKLALSGNGNIAAFITINGNIAEINIYQFNESNNQLELQQKLTDTNTELGNDNSTINLELNHDGTILAVSNHNYDN